MSSRSGADLPGLVVRADVGLSVGMGHLGRCLALAQGWRRRGGAATFVLVEPPDPVVARLAEEGFGLVVLDVQPGSAADVEATLEAAGSGPGGGFVLDGYRFGTPFQEALAAAGTLVVVDDDGRAGRYVADLVVNQNLHASEGLYPGRAAHTKLLLGAEYVLLRDEFLAGREDGPVAERATRLLVTLGGGDQADLAVEIHRRLAALPSLTRRAVLGPGQTDSASLASALAATGAEVVAATNDMAALMRWADLAVSAAGSTGWELAFSGVPAVLIPLSGDQVAVADHLAASGAAVCIRPDEAGGLVGVVEALVDDRDGRAAMAGAGRMLVDGRGADRVAAEIAGLRPGDGR